MWLVMVTSSAEVDTGSGRGARKLGNFESAATFSNACAQLTLNCSSPKLATTSRRPPRAVT